MGGFKILKIKDISEAELTVNDCPSKELKKRFDWFLEMNGQTKSIAVCEGINGYQVLDGNKYFKSLKKAGLKTVLVYNYGVLSLEEYVCFRVLLNVHEGRIDHCGIAELILLLGEHSNANRISNRIGLSVEDVLKYKKLLNFNWEKFLKTKNESQLNQFDYEQ